MSANADLNLADLTCAALTRLYWRGELATMSAAHPVLPIAIDGSQ